MLTSIDVKFPSYFACFSAPPPNFIPFLIICYWKSWNEQILNRIMRNKRFNLFFTKISIFLQNVKKFPPFYPALPNLIPQGFSGDDFCF